MSRAKITSWFQVKLFANRIPILLVFLATSVFMAYHATSLRMEAGFEKLLPLEHDYLKTLLEYRDEFGSGNQLIIALTVDEGDIFTEEFFGALRVANEEVFFLPGVARHTVTSILTPNVRFIELVEDGFQGGNVVPAEFRSTPEWFSIIRSNIIKSGRLGNLVANDFSGAMIRTELLDMDPTTREPLDYQQIAAEMEARIRDAIETDNIKVRIIGFAKSTGDIADGARVVMLFFAATFVFTALFLYLYTRLILATLLPVFSGLVAVVWQMGLLPLMGFGLDPMSILVPFLVFSIGVSHGVQKINAWLNEIMYGAAWDDEGRPVVPAPESDQGVDGLTAAKRAFQALFIPGIIALISDTVGFLTVLLIDIGIIREMAIAATVGVAAIIFTNLVLLPILLSYIKVSNLDKLRAKQKASEERLDPVWRGIAALTHTGPATVIVVVCIALTAWGMIKNDDLKVGDSQAGIPELRENARYNVDSRVITERFSIGVDKLTVMIESKDNACVDFEVMDEIDRFAWHIRNLPGVQSVASLVDKQKLLLAANNEGSPRWFQLSKNPSTMSSSLYHMGAGGAEFMNAPCSAMPVNIYTADHKAETINTIIDGINAFQSALPEELFRPRLAAGNVGIIAATNVAVEEAQLPIMLWEYAAIMLLVYITFRSVGGVLCIILPLSMVSILCYALMAMLGIGLKVNTLPVVALGVGVGVDYAVYIYSRMTDYIDRGQTLPEAVYQAMRLTGKPIIFTGMVLGVGVGAWMFAPLKFQADMGILLTFMFVVNMLGAIIVMPALARFFLGPKLRSVQKKAVEEAIALDEHKSL
ncbi:MAG: RND family transporter [Gammaproteobacteria bacterium]|nr:MAG: RND family transporter [Gammaproteobacteria bacterium]RLA49639.1 MAG: RND family transporter [Gammaproteobacteria bacterium]